MAGTVEQKLAAQGIVLNEPRTPMANYVGFVRTGNLLFVSGQVCFDQDGKLIAKGKLGAGVSTEQGNAAARGCGINLLAQLMWCVRIVEARGKGPLLVLWLVLPFTSPFAFLYLAFSQPAPIKSEKHVPFVLETA